MTHAICRPSSSHSPAPQFAARREQSAPGQIADDFDLQPALPTGLADSLRRERPAPPRRASLLGPGPSGAAIQQPSFAPLSPALSCGPGATRAWPYGALGMRPTRRASDGPEDKRVDPTSNEALQTVVRERFMCMRQTDQALRAPPPVLQMLRLRTGLEVVSGNADQERWFVVRFGDDCYMSIEPVDPERATSWYHLGAWPNTVHNTAIRP